MAVSFPTESLVTVDKVIRSENRHVHEAVSHCKDFRITALCTLQADGYPVRTRLDQSNLVIGCLLAHWSVTGFSRVGRCMKRL